MVSIINHCFAAGSLVVKMDVSSTSGRTHKQPVINGREVSQVYIYIYMHQFIEEIAVSILNFAVGPPIFTFQRPFCCSTRQVPAHHGNVGWCHSH